MLIISFISSNSFKPNTFLRFCHHDSNCRLMGYLLHKLGASELSNNILQPRSSRLCSGFHRIILNFGIVSICYYIKQKHWSRLHRNFLSHMCKWSIKNKLEYFHSNIVNRFMLNFSFTISSSNNSSFGL